MEKVLAGETKSYVFSKDCDQETEASRKRDKLRIRRVI